MTDAKGNLLTSDKVIQNRALEVFASSLKSNKVIPNLEALEKVVNDLCEIKIKLSKQNKSEPWNINDRKDVLKHFCNDKARDPEGMIIELFKESVAGVDLLEAVLKVMNIMKKSQKY